MILFGWYVGSLLGCSWLSVFGFLGLVGVGLVLIAGVCLLGVRVVLFALAIGC